VSVLSCANSGDSTCAAASFASCLSGACTASVWQLHGSFEM
jgi:hypothetical protein